MKNETIKIKGIYCMDRCMAINKKTNSFTGDYIYSIFYRQNRAYFIYFSCTSKEEIDKVWSGIQDTTSVPSRPVTKNSYKTNKYKMKMGLL